MRRYKRKQAGYPCIVTLDDGQQYACRIVNVSPRGAQIAGLEQPIPKGTLVRVSWDRGKSVRACCVMWTNGGTAGVQFVGGPDDLKPKRRLSP
jgi:hypothetical protein